jgi:cytochrome oxidase assembly protein ShyY1
MSEYVGLNLINGVFLELINENDFNNYPITKDPKAELPNNHLQYAITWTILGFTFLVMNYIYLRRNK